MQIPTGYENRRPRVEIVPLIDVVFLLLVFFIYAMLSMTVYRGLRVDLPAGHGSKEDKTVIVTIAADNTFSIDGRSLARDDAIVEAVERATDRNAPVLVSGDSSADLGTAIEFLDGLRKAGVTAVSFQVKEGE